MSERRSRKAARAVPASGRPGPRGRRPARQAARWRWPVLAGIGAAVVGALVVLAVLYYQHSASPTRAQANPAPGTVEGAPVDGIRCETMEQALYHVHAHLAIYASGQARTVSYGVGIPDASVQQTAQGPYVAQGSCFYWLHTHAADGVIHVESPDQRAYTLGEFFDLWGQPLSPTRVGEDSGQVIAYVNGQRYQGDPRSVSLGAHAVIQLDVGTDVSPAPYTFASGL